MIGDDLESADAMIDNWESSLAKRAELAKAFSERAATVTGTATSKDGAIGVTVDTSGGLVGLHLSERIRQRPAHETADEILAVTRMAQVQLSQEMARAAAEMPGNNDIAETIVAYYATRFPPPVVADDEQR